MKRDTVFMNEKSLYLKDTIFPTNYLCISISRITLKEERDGANIKKYYKFLPVL